MIEYSIKVKERFYLYLCCETIKEGRLEERENLARKREEREAGLDRVETLVEQVIRLNKHNRCGMNRMAGLTHPITPCLRMTFW